MWGITSQEHTHLALGLACTHTHTHTRLEKQQQGAKEGHTPSQAVCRLVRDTLKRMTGTHRHQDLNLWVSPVFLFEEKPEVPHTARSSTWNITGSLMLLTDGSKHEHTKVNPSVGAAGRSVYIHSNLANDDPDLSGFTKKRTTSKTWGIVNSGKWRNTSCLCRSA